MVERNSMVSGKRWKVSTTMILALPFLRMSRRERRSVITQSPAIIAFGNTTFSWFSACPRPTPSPPAAPCGR